MTESDASLKRTIAAVRRDLAKCRPGGWTAEKIAEKLAALERQLARPRAEREQFQISRLAGLP